MAPMPEMLVGEFNALFPRVEQPAGEPLQFALAKGIGNSGVRDGLRAFSKSGMESPQAAQALLRLFAPIEGGPQGDNLWEQVGSAYTRPELRTKHKDDLVATNYFLLDSLAQGGQELRIHGKTKPLTKETAALAQKIFDQYSKFAATTLDPEDPRSVKALQRLGKTAKAAPPAAMATLLAACAGQAVVVPPIYETPPAVVSPIGESTSSSTAPEATVMPSADLSPEALAQQEGVNIFDIESFPEQFQRLMKDSESLQEATTEDLQNYQRFIEAARSRFFEEQGIASEVSAIKGINPELRSIWGVIYWMQSHRDQVIPSGITPVISPLELDIIRAEPLVQPWVKNIKIPSGKAGWALYGRNLSAANGDMAFMGRLFVDDPNTLVNILHMESSPEENFSYSHILYADVVVFDENFTLPAGTSCQAARVGEIVHPQPLPVDVLLGFPDHYSGQDIPITKDTYLEAMGANVGTSHLVGLSIDGDLAVTSCEHPSISIEVETQFQSQGYIGSGQFEDWTSTGSWSW